MGEADGAPRWAGRCRALGVGDSGRWGSHEASLNREQGELCNAASHPSGSPEITFLQNPEKGNYSRNFTARGNLLLVGSDLKNCIFSAFLENDLLLIDSFLWALNSCCWSQHNFGGGTEVTCCSGCSSIKALQGFIPQRVKAPHTQKRKGERNKEQNLLFKGLILEQMCPKY